jgi:hypothetical protein
MPPTDKYFESPVSDYFCDDHLRQDVLERALDVFAARLPMGCLRVERRDGKTILGIRHDCLNTINYVVASRDGIVRLLESGKFHFGMTCRSSTVIVGRHYHSIIDLTILNLTLIEDEVHGTFEVIQPTP